MSGAAELKPCPFCGSPATLIYPPLMGGDNKPDMTVASAACSKINCVSMNYATTEGAINQWNTRAEK